MVILIKQAQTYRAPPVIPGLDGYGGARLMVLVAGSTPSTGDSRSFQSKYLQKHEIRAGKSGAQRDGVRTEEERG